MTSSISNNHNNKEKDMTCEYRCMAMSVATLNKILGEFKEVRPMTYRHKDELLATVIVDYIANAMAYVQMNAPAQDVVIGMLMTQQPAN